MIMLNRQYFKYLQIFMIVFYVILEKVSDKTLVYIKLLYITENLNYCKEALQILYMHHHSRHSYLVLGTYQLKYYSSFFYSYFVNDNKMHDLPESLNEIIMALLYYSTMFCVHKVSYFSIIHTFPFVDTVINSQHNFYKQN